MTKRKWFEETFFPSLVERYKKNGKFKLTPKQAHICHIYMKGTKYIDFCEEFNGYGVYQVSYSQKNPLKWKNGYWFEELHGRTID